MALLLELDATHRAAVKAVLRPAIESLEKACEDPRKSWAVLLRDVRGIVGVLRAKLEIVEYDDAPVSLSVTVLGLKVYALEAVADTWQAAAREVGGPLSDAGWKPTRANVEDVARYLSSESSRARAEIDELVVEAGGEPSDTETAATR